MGGAAEKIAEAVARIRQEAGLGRLEFGERIKVTEEAVRLYENGERTPSKTVLKRILELGRVPKGTAKTLLHLRQRLPQSPVLDEKTRAEVAMRILRTVELGLKEQDIVLSEDNSKELLERIADVLGEEFDGNVGVQPEESRVRLRQQQPAHPEGNDQRRRRQASPHLRDR